MPQLMPLNWFMSVFMVGFLLFMLIKMYYVINYQFMVYSEKKINKSLNWLW